MEEFKQQFVQLLTIIGFREDFKDEFAQNFVESLLLESMMNLIDSLPIEKQEEFRQKLEELQDNPQEMQLYFSQTFSEEQMFGELEHVFTENVSAFLESVSPDLTEDQFSEIMAYADANEPKV